MNFHPTRERLAGTGDGTSVSDWSLVVAAPFGSDAAYSALVAKYQTAIRRFILRSVRDEETARDLAQEVFVKAWFGLPKAERRGRFTTWLFQIAVNVCRDYARSKSARNDRMTYSIVFGVTGELSQDQEFAHPIASPDRLVEEAEAVATLEGEIWSLPEKLRVPFVLCAVEGLSLKEAAVRLGASAKAVEVRIYRARRILHDRIQRLSSPWRSTAL